MKYIKGSDADEAYFYRAYQILSEVSVTDEKHKVPLHSVVQPVWSGGNPEIWRGKGRYARSVADPQVQSFFQRRI